MGYRTTRRFHPNAIVCRCAMLVHLLPACLLLVGCQTVGRSVAPDANVGRQSAVSPHSNGIVAPAKNESPVRPVAFQDDGERKASTNAGNLNQPTGGAEAAEPQLLGTPDPVVLSTESRSYVDAAESFNTAASYTLADVEQMALGNNPAIAAASATTCKAVGLHEQVGTKPNPTLGYFGQQIADEATDQHGFYVEREFVRGNKLQLNRAALSHTMAAQRFELDTQRYRVLTDVRVRFFDALAAQEQLEATRKFLAVASRGVQVALARQKAEEGNAIEVLQAKTLLSEIALAAEQNEVAYRGAWQDVAAVAGLPGSTPARLVAELTSSSDEPDWDVAYAEIVAQSPELSVARELVCEKSALLRRQEAQAIPNITAQLGAGFDNATDSGLINLQVSAPLPIHNKNCGNIKAARAAYARATENVRRVELAIKSRLARTAQEFDSSLAAVRKYEQEIIPQAQQSLDLSEQAYRAGELDFVQVLIVRRSYYESMIRFIAAKGQLAQANAKVDGLLLTGGLEAPQDYTDGDGIRGQSFGGQ